MKKILSTLAFLALVTGIVLYAGGFFARDTKVMPGPSEEAPGLPPPSRTVRAERQAIDVWESAVGTVRSRTRVDVASQVTARVLEVRTDVGSLVRTGEELLVLDDREPAARLDQARQGLAAAEAAREGARQAKASSEAVLSQAKARYERIKSLLTGEAATPQQMEDAEAAYLQAQASVADADAAITASVARIHQAQKVVDEAQVALGHTRIAAPLDGVVAERSVDPGDLAVAGRTLLVVLDPHALRLEAEVREGLIAHVRSRERLPIDLPAAGLTLEGTVAEIIPAADPRTRTFRVRVTFEEQAGVYPGMFGRLRLPAGRREVVALPAAAIVRVGQLETVEVHQDGRWVRRLVTTGQPLAGGGVEILSGLEGGEEVGIPGGGA